MWEFILLLSLAGSLTMDKEYEKSEKILNCIPYSESNVEKIIYYRMINCYELNRKEETIKYADLLLNSFVELPMRYKDLATIIKGEAESWETGDESLEDIAREMKIIRDRLAGPLGPGDTPKEGNTPKELDKTIEMQKSVADRLERMIKKEEKAREDAIAKAMAEAEGKLEKIEQGVRPPADTTPSRLPNASGVVESKRVKEIANVWGTLPEKERARALLELTRQMPAKDRTIVEAYFKELNRRTSRR